MAIDAKTLRVGNKVLDQDGRELVITESSSLSYSRYRGIPITDNIFNRLRFQFDNGEGCWVRHSPTPIRIFKHPDGYFYLLNFPKGKLEFAHQLQNLIYDLTREETEEFDKGSFLGSVLEPGR